MLNLKNVIFLVLVVLSNPLLYAESKKAAIDTSGTLKNGLPPDVFPGYWTSTSVVESGEVYNFDVPKPIEHIQVEYIRNNVLYIEAINVIYLGKKINIPLDKLETRRVFERPRLIMGNKQMTEFSVFIQYFSDPDKEVAVYHGRCYPRSPNALKVNFTLNGIKDMEVLKRD
jgi:hypothetical protein